MHQQKEYDEELVLPKTLASMAKRILVEMRLQLIDVALVHVILMYDGRFLRILAWSHQTPHVGRKVHHLHWLVLVLVLVLRVVRHRDHFTIANTRPVVGLRSALLCVQ